MVDQLLPYNGPRHHQAVGISVMRYRAFPNSRVGTREVLFNRGHMHAKPPFDFDDPKFQILTVTNRKHGGFSAPGGKVKTNETLQAAALRELYEETGLEALTLDCLGVLPHAHTEGDGDETPWLTTYFAAQVGFNVIWKDIKQVEDGTIPEWRPVKDLIESDESYLKLFYKDLFAHLGWI